MSCLSFIPLSLTSLSHLEPEGGITVPRDSSWREVSDKERDIPSLHLPHLYLISSLSHQHAKDDNR